MLSKIKWFAKYYRNYPYVLAVLILVTPFQALLQATIPRMFGFAVDFLQTGEISDHFLARFFAETGAGLGLSPVASFGWGFILVGFVATVAYAYMQTHRAWMNLKLEWLFRQDAFANSTTKGPDFFLKFRIGDLVTRMTDDVAEKLSWFACSGIFRFYEALLNVIFIIIMMYSIDPVLTLWTAGPLPLLILVYYIFSSSLDKRYDHLQSRISRFNDVVEAAFSGIRVILAYVLETAQKKKFNDAAQDRRQAEIDAVKLTTAVDSLWMYLWQFSIVIVLIAGGYQVINAGLSLGSMSVFIYYVVWLVFPMFDIGQFLVKGRQSAVSINRLLELEEMPDLVTENGSLPIDSNGSGELVVEKVSLEFAGAEKNILTDISLIVKQGETVAFVGKVGSGKSWLVNMIPRLVDPTGGKIKLGGHDLQKFSLEDLRKYIGYVPQEPVLFSDSVKNNILFGREDIDDGTLNWAIELAQLKEEIELFPKGIETTIGNRGISISGGQKQRLALARALVGKPKLLILDDCTSALDSKTESALWDGLHKVLPDITAIIITHRPDTLEKVDRIYVLEDGKIIESGKHSELMLKETVYASIYKRYQLEEEVNQ